MTRVLILITGNQAISIHMPHTWHDIWHNADATRQSISIHMPHTWHDIDHVHIIRQGRISIHMPHTWHDSRINEN